MSTDYFPPIQRAIAGLADNSVETRRAMYDRARNALVKQLRGMNPPLSEAQVQVERMGLEDAIRRVESAYAPPTAAPPPSLPPIAMPPPLRDPFEDVREAARDARALGSTAAPATEPPRPPVAAEAAPQRAESRSDTRRRPPPPPPQGAAAESSSRLGLSLAIGAVLALLVIGIAGAFIYRSIVAPPATDAQSAATAAPAAPAIDPGGKIADRLGEEPATPAAPATTETPAEPSPPPPAEPSPPVQEQAAAPPAEPLVPAPPPEAAPQVAQRARFFEEDPASPQRGQQFAGTVTWRTESVSTGAGAPLEISIKGEVTIPERNLRLLMTIRRNADPVLPASHIIDLQFAVPPDYPNGGVQNVPGLLMKDGEAMTGLPLKGQSVRVTPGTFLVGLLDPPADTGLNAQLMRQRAWIDVPLLFDNGRKAIISIEKGLPGDRVFSDAFAAWDQAAARAQ